jgi:hypothetical protein
VISRAIYQVAKQESLKNEEIDSDCSRNGRSLSRLGHPCLSFKSE